MRHFELFVAKRYLRARRKQAVVSVITVISIVGVAAGVMALVVALAINNGFRSTLQRNLLSATAHVSILEKEPGYGIENWRELDAKLRQLPGVVNASATLYGQVLFSGPLQSTGGILKGVDLSQPIDVLRNLKQGSVAALAREGGLPGIILGSRLAQNTGMRAGSVVTVISPQGEMTPFGPKITRYQFKVVGIFETGFYELDANWAYTSLKNTQMVLSLTDVVNSIEIKLDNPDRAPDVARRAQAIIPKTLGATHWAEQNRPILNALRMEKTVTVITIGLIQLVAALNILIALVMAVMEKNRDIAILMSMGAKKHQIQRIFMLQGVLIGVVGSVIGLTVGHTLCYLADKYRWVRLDEEVYSLAFVPFDPRWTDSIWIAAIAILVSFVATIYPARSAVRVSPVETLRYE